MSHFAHLLAHRHSITCIALLGVLLNVLGLHAPAFTDDYLQWAIFSGSIDHTRHPGSVFGLFDLVDGSTAQRQAMKDAGRLLWSAADSLRLSFWRPVSELTHALDHALWPRSPWLMRLHSLLWYGALLALLGRLYRMLDASKVRSGLAAALFATSCMHFFVIMWISARNQLIAACFSVLTLMAYHSWRSTGTARYGWLGCLSLLFGLLSAEAGVATGAYLLAYALCYEQGKAWPERLLSLAPYLALIVAWRMVHVTLGFGSTASGSYIEPGLNARFIHALAQRLPALMFAEVTGISAGIQAPMSDDTAWLYAGVTSMCLALMAWLAAHWGLWSHAVFRFHAMGSVLALIPACAIGPTDRVLLTSEIGMSWLLAALFCRALSRWRHIGRGWRARSGRAMAGLLLGVHAGLFPIGTLLLPLLTSSLATRSIEEPLSLPDEIAGPGKQVILVNPPGPFMLFYYPLIRSYFGRPNPAAMHALANNASQALKLTVLDERTIQLESDTCLTQPLMRDTIAQPFKAGDTAMMGQIKVIVTKVSPAGEPLSVAFRFPAPVTHPRWHFYTWREPRYEPLSLPPVGQPLSLAGFDPLQAARDRLRLPFSKAATRVNTITIDPVRDRQTRMLESHVEK